MCENVSLLIDEFLFVNKTRVILFRDCCKIARFQSEVTNMNKRLRLYSNPNSSLSDIFMKSFVLTSVQALHSGICVDAWKFHIIMSQMRRSWKRNVQSPTNAKLMARLFSQYLICMSIFLFFILLFIYLLDWLTYLFCIKLLSLILTSAFF